MRRFEFVEGTSSKFWCIDLQGTSFTVTFGRIGTAGQSQSKTFATPEKARAEHDKLVAEKVKKGYSEVGGGTTPAPVAAPKAPKPPTKKAEAAPPETPAAAPTPPAPPPAASTHAAPDAASEDGVLWTEALEKDVVPRRGSAHCRPPPALKPARKSWGRVKEVLSERHAAIGEVQQDLRKPIALSLAQEMFASGGAEKDAFLLGVLEWRPRWDSPSAGAEYMDLLTSTVGVHHAAEVLLRALEDGPPGDLKGHHMSAHHTKLDALVRLRELLFSADEPAFEAAQNAAEGQRKRGRMARSASSFLFPDAPWVGDDVAALIAGNGHIVTLAAVTRREDFAALAPLLAGNLFSQWGGADLERYTLAATILEHAGIAVAPFVVAAVPQYATTEAARDRAAVLAALGCDEAVAALVLDVEQREAQAALMDAARRQPRRVIRLLAPRAAQRGKVADTVQGVLGAVLRQYPGLAAEVFPTLEADGQRVLSAIASASADEGNEASPENVPAFLQRAPWLDRPRPRAVSLTVEAPRLPDEVKWNPGEKEQWAAVPFWDYQVRDRASWKVEDWKKHIAVASKVPFVEVVSCPPELLNSALAKVTDLGWNSAPTMTRAVERHGIAMLPFLQSRAASEPSEVVPVAGPYACTALAPVMADALATNVDGGQKPRGNGAERVRAREMFTAARPMVKGLRPGPEIE
ncbi:MAG: WGR domain-containing protein [Deltaproteobacteria bacterium]|nr:WGR domain-containing protein [Deltaproteobacteria bacterium]